MKYSTAANWEMDLLEKLEGTSVTGLYGQIWNDPLGGGRMALFLPRVDRDQAATYIREARKKGLEFNYLVNILYYYIPLFYYSYIFLYIDSTAPIVHIIFKVPRLQSVCFFGEFQSFLNQIPNLQIFLKKQCR